MCRLRENTCSEKSLVRGVEDAPGKDFFFSQGEEMVLFFLSC